MVAVPRVFQAILAKLLGHAQAHSVCPRLVFHVGAGFLADADAKGSLHRCLQRAAVAQGAHHIGGTYPVHLQLCRDDTKLAQPLEACAVKAGVVGTERAALKHLPVEVFRLAHIRKLSI